MQKYYQMTTMNYIGYLPISALIKYNWYYLPGRRETHEVCFEAFRPTEWRAAEAERGDSRTGES